MPTTRPRYAVTDTGEVRTMIDAAQARWPEVTDRKQLLLLLAAEGRAALEERAHGEAAVERRSRQLAALRRAESLVDAKRLLSDAHWR